VDSIKKLCELSSASQIEAGEEGCRQASLQKTDRIVLTRALLPNGRSIPLLKSLLTSCCENDCFYCPCRAGRDGRRTTFQPEEFAKLVISLTRAGLIQGVFLSSGVVDGGIRTQEKLIATAEILRKKLDYRGYLHLKIMPGAEFAQVEASMRLADRVSINLEAPNPLRLKNLAPQKDFSKQLFNRLTWIHQIRQNEPASDGWQGRWPSSCTQFVVGGAGESDQELLQTAQDVHRFYGVLRAYFSAFRPHADTPLAEHAPVPYKREQRLYQADYLLRDYGFMQSELIYDVDGNLPLAEDPKLMWAQRHLLEQPVEINRASREELLRVPGFGPQAVKAILAARRTHTLRDVSSLIKIGINAQRAKEFVLLDGLRSARQLVLFKD